MTVLQDGDAHDAGPGSSIGVRLPPDLRAKIEAAAAKEALSVSSWLRRAALRELHGRPMPERIVAGMEADAATHQGREGMIRQDAA